MLAPWDENRWQHYHTEGDCIVGLGTETGGDVTTQKVTALSALGHKDRRRHCAEPNLMAMRHTEGQ